MSLITGLSDRYPHLGFDGRPLAIACDDGWLGILHAFFADANKAMAAGGMFTLQRVKEKMGGLTIHYAVADVAPDARRAIDDAYRLATARSFHICESCGRRGRLNNFNGLWKVACSEHADGELGKGVPFEGPSNPDDPYSPEADPFVAVRPTVTEFNAAPIIEGWLIEDQSESGPRSWLFGWFFGQPDISDGEHGHTSPIVQMDEMVPPRWVRTDNRLYRLGIYYPPSEREIRYWVQKLARRPVVHGEPPGGSDDIEAMLIFLRSTGRLRPTKIDRMEQAYRAEQECQKFNRG
ncbi:MULTISPECIES: hypothetical protein [unclassified Sinorhizobium]|uniref:hypothetical protein n=1 Tax=unclassified Sinorhizobium TaxID=2613772 RepID=UPI0024C46467|nr:MULTISPECIES: hypothetical protein [unclassified Sinorhizobium]MDK1376831.1 hypothetical protein [Sinorhizobium sp. 6-70]MDK1481068.1 hypothetical protein [Sinorhizobium sp. 6-117]